MQVAFDYDSPSLLLHVTGDYTPKVSALSPPEGPSLEITGIYAYSLTRPPSLSPDLSPYLLSAFVSDIIVFYCDTFPEATP